MTSRSRQVGQPPPLQRQAPPAYPPSEVASRVEVVRRGALPLALSLTRERVDAVCQEGMQRATGAKVGGRGSEGGRQAPRLGSCVAGHSKTDPWGQTQALPEVLQPECHLKCHWAGKTCPAQAPPPIRRQTTHAPGSRHAALPAGAVQARSPNQPGAVPGGSAAGLKQAEPDTASVHCHIQPGPTAGCGGDQRTPDMAGTSLPSYTKELGARAQGPPRQTDRTGQGSPGAQQQRREEQGGIGSRGRECPTAPSEVKRSSNTATQQEQRAREPEPEQRAREPEPQPPAELHAGWGGGPPQVQPCHRVTALGDARRHRQRRPQTTVTQGGGAQSLLAVTEFGCFMQGQPTGSRGPLVRGAGGSPQARCHAREQPARPGRLRE